MSNKPPNGVTNPIDLKLKPVNSLVANPYMDPENKITPITISRNIHDFDFVVILLEFPTNNKSSA